MVKTDSAFQANTVRSGFRLFVELFTGKEYLVQSHHAYNTALLAESPVLPALEEIFAEPAAGQSSFSSDPWIKRAKVTL